MDGIQRAAILLYSLGPETAAEIIKFLNPKEVQAIGSKMVDVEKVEKGILSDVFKGFVQEVSGSAGLGMDSKDYIKEMLSTALGGEQADAYVDRILLGGSTNGLDALKWMEPKAIADTVRYEHPQIIAIVLSYIEPIQAAKVLTYMEDDLRADLIQRIGSLEAVQPSALQQLNDILEQQFSGGSSEKRSIGGLKSAAEIMNMMDGTVEAVVMEQLKERDLEMGESIEDLMFVFADLVGVEDRSMQRMLQDVPQDILMLALKGADNDMRDKVFNNMSKRAAELLKDDLEVAGPTKVSEVEAAQKEVLVVARRLADSGEIVLAGKDEEMI